MTNATTSNSISTENVVLWQYDRATNFCALVTLIENIGKTATEEFWDYFLNHVDALAAVDSTGKPRVDDFGLAVWGILLGLPRPLLTYVKSGASEATTQALTSALYRKVLLARLKLLATDGSLDEISRYAANIFGFSKVEVVDGLDMSLTYRMKSGESLESETYGTGSTAVTITAEEKTALYALGDYWQFYPAGVRDNAPPVTRFLAFKAQHLAQLAAVREEDATATAADTTTKPNFFSGTDTSGVDWTGVFHPKARGWRFCDTDGDELESSVSATYVSTTVPEAATVSFDSTSVSESATATGSNGQGATASVVSGSTGVATATVTDLSAVSSLVGGASGTYTLEYRLDATKFNSAWYLGNALVGYDLTDHGLALTYNEWYYAPAIGDRISLVFTAGSSVSGVSVVTSAFGSYVNRTSGTYTLVWDGTGWKATTKEAYFDQITYPGTPTTSSRVTVAYTAPGGITGATVAASTFGGNVTASGSYEFEYDDDAGWTLSGKSVVLVNYGINIVGSANDGDTVTVAYTAPSGISGVTVDRDAYATKVENVKGSKTFTRTSTGWTLSGASVDLTAYGVTVIGTPATGNTVTVTLGGVYTMEFAAESAGSTRGTWTLKLDGTAKETQPRSSTGGWPTCRNWTVWSDYGVYFPTEGVLAVWRW